MNITKQKGSDKRSGRCFLQLEGDMTIYNATEFGENLLEYVEDFKEFKLDMSGVNEIDTAGIQLLLQLKNKAQEEERTIQLDACNETLCDLFELYQLTDWLAPATDAKATAGEA